MVNQYKVFSAVMNNFDQAVKATEASLNSQGATAKQNAIYMESLEAKTQALKAQFEKLVLGDGGLQKIAKLFVDLGTGILKLANTTVGNLIVKITALSVVFGGLGVLLKGTQLWMIGTTIATQGLTAGLEALGIAISANPLGLLAIGASTLIVAFTSINDLVHETDNSLEELHKNVMSSASGIDNLSSSVESLKNQLQSIENRKINITDEKELSILNQEEQHLRNQLDIQEEQLRIAREKASIEAQKALTQTTTQVNTLTGETNEVTRQEALKLNIDYVRQLEEEYNNLETELAKLAESGQTETKQYQDKSAQLESLKTIILENKEANNELSQSLLEEASLLVIGTDANGEFIYSNKELYDSVMESIEAHKEYIGASGESKEVTEQQKEELNALAEIWGITKEAVQEYMSENNVDEWEAITALIEDQQGKILELDESYKNSIQSLNDMASNFDILSSVMNDYNNTGYLSIENLTKLLSLDDEYLQLLQFENGQMSLNQQGIEAMANARIDEAEAMAYDKAMKEIDQVASENLKNATDALNASSGETVQTNANAGQSINNLIPILVQGAEAWNQYHFEKSGGKYANVTQNGIKQIQQINANLSQQISALENARANIGNYAKAVASGTQNTKGSTGATKANTKARDENAEAINAQKTQLEAYIKTLEKEKEALEEQEDKYKTALDYMIKNLEKYIDWLEEARDAELDVIEAQIDALEKEQDSIMEIREKELKQLESEQDKLIEQRKEELDALKKHKEEVKDAYSEEIDKIKERNDSLNEQLELEKKIEAVANAKSKKVRVFRDGQFVYESDTSAVSKAQQELSDYQEELKRKQSIKELERERDSILAILDSEIDANKASTEEIEKSYDTRIKVYKDTTQVLKDQYEQQKSILESQKQQIKDNYAEQIKEVQSYKDMLTQVKGAYQDFQDQMTTAEMTGLEFANKSYEERFKLIKDFSSESKKYYDKCVKDGQDFSTSYISNLSSINDNLSRFVANFNATLDKLKGITIDISSAKAQLAQLNTLLSATQAQAEQTRASVTTATIPSTASTPETIYRFQYVGTEAKYDSESGELEGSFQVFKEIESGRKYSDRNLISAGLNGKQVEGVRNGSFTLTQQEYQNLMRAQASKGGSYASGVSSIKSDQIAVVGEDPNKEIVLGSKVNNGTLMSLDKGTGVVNAKSTNTLAGLLNLVGSFGRSNFGGVFGNAISNNSNSETIIIENVTIDGARITDIESFKNGLMSMKSEAIQRAYRR